MAGKPVVALETTIVSHGMPWPDNLETALAVEAVVRAAGAVPAAIAVIGGTIRVGLTRAELERLAQAKDVLKLSSADIAYALTAGRTGATTVAATMIAAHLAGIRVFATGGIGGVHRGAEQSFDISADLTELSKHAGHRRLCRRQGAARPRTRRWRCWRRWACRWCATAATPSRPSGRATAASPRRSASTMRRRSPASCAPAPNSARPAACSSPTRCRKPTRSPSPRWRR